MKKQYDELKIKISYFFADDVITQSQPFVPGFEDDEKDTELPPVWL